MAGAARSPGLRSRIARINFARLNHILIPPKKPDRDRLRKGATWKFLWPMFWFVSALSREGRAFVVLTLLVGAAGVDVADTEVYWLFAAMTGLLFGALAIRPLFRLNACKIEVSAPLRVAAHEPQTFTLSLRNTGTRDLTSLRVERPFLPWDGKWIGEPIGVPRVVAKGACEVRTQATFIERGEHHLDAFEMAALVPLGLAVGRRVSSSGCRFLVVPRQAMVASVKLERARPRTEGPRVTRVTPGGDELAGVRPYVRGDPLKHLHVRTWARTGMPHVRHYVEEESSGVMLILALDATDAPEPRIEAAVSLAAGIASRLITGGTGVDYLVAGNDVVHVAPRRGRAALDFILDTLAKLAPERRETNTLETARSLAGSVASAMIVCADESPRRRALEEGLRQSGMPCKLVEVVDDGALAPAPHSIPASRIERREPIAC